MTTPSLITVALSACPVCRTPRPRHRRGDDIWCCSITCYRRWHQLDTEEATTNH